MASRGALRRPDVQQALGSLCSAQLALHAAVLAAALAGLSFLGKPADIRVAGDQPPCNATSFAQDGWQTALGEAAPESRSSMQSRGAQEVGGATTRGYAPDSVWRDVRSVAHLLLGAFVCLALHGNLTIGGEGQRTVRPSSLTSRAGRMAEDDDDDDDSDGALAGSGRGGRGDRAADAWPPLDEARGGAASAGKGALDVGLLLM